MKTIEITKDGIIFELSQNELIVLCNVLNETIKSIEAWEFQTRTGLEIEEAEVLLKELTICYNKTLVAS